MKTNKDMIMEKQEELISAQKELIMKVKEESVFSFILWNRVLLFESELSILKGEYVESGSKNIFTYGKE